MEAQAVPEWKYQRQFGYQEGVRSSQRRFMAIERQAPRLLGDEAMRFFIANGFLTLKTTLPEAFHRTLYDRFVDIVGSDNDRNPGNNLLPLMPEINEVFEDPAVKGALTSVLGPDYLMHPHRVLHDNPPGSDQQVWHHDSYWGYKRKVHNHRPWWVMIMYYPQELFDQIGPTGIIPGSHCIAQRLGDIDQIGLPARGPAGTCVMIHYDIWHRKMKNFTNLKRFMVKFEFTRMSRPQRPAWNNRASAWRMPKEPPPHLIEPMWQDQWRWHRGEPAAPPAEGNGAAASAPSTADAAALATLAARLDDVSEPAGLSAAYALGALGKPAVPTLVDAMLGNDGDSVDDARVFIDEGQHSEVEMTARNAAHGLVAIGRDAIPALLDALPKAGPRVRKYTVFALGEIAGDEPSVLQALADGVADPDVYVRINAVEALGLKAATPVTVAALAAALSDAEDEVRFNAALSLARLGPGAAAAVPALASVLEDGNRYVVGYAIEALERIATPDALAVLLPFLKTARWCPITTSRSLF
jgi:HEAT repeat protein